ncbi:hypothetical protein [Xylocopilactobacillus apis]|uniref:Uncharacterized protein n=1 Tax=Xylocopilactobacillus apis TaxID=2932183 RepID=A0AAU9D1I0_9LACO|nr:hypothetical protein [Xylocopilactobacillus apis]BDR56336.1 hypothetical protein KIMC2_08980 [Xylocopilactobacillus apis]
MCAEVQFIPFGDNLDLVKNVKSNFLRINLDKDKSKANRSSIKVRNKEIYLGEIFHAIDLIEEVVSPVGLKLNTHQIQRLIDQKVISISGSHVKVCCSGTYVLNFKYYSQQKGAILTVKDYVSTHAVIESVDLRKNVKTRLDLTRYYRYANVINHSQKTKGENK